MDWFEFTGAIVPLLFVGVGTVLWYFWKEIMRKLESNDKNITALEEELRKEIGSVSDMAKETKIKLESHDKFVDKIDKKMDEMYGSIKGIEIAMAKIVSNGNK